MQQVAPHWIFSLDNLIKYFPDVLKIFFYCIVQVSDELYFHFHILNKAMKPFQKLGYFAYHLFVVVPNIFSDL